MNQADILKSLTAPVPLEGIVDDINIIEGAALDSAEASAEQLLQEVLPDLALITMSDWERILGIPTNPELTLVERRRGILVKFFSRGLSKTFFIQLAALLGQTITIDDVSTQWEWIVSGLVSSDDFARAGEICAGERLGGSSMDIETIFNTLKPAHTLVSFEYVS
ncbi:MAG: DUF2313 domain-containing protein [Elusimicrobia bacterium]|nr:DUF2313 domain-containing protein [Elusimicrobiota bacterium]